MKSIAIAVFVKTLNQTALKTRLASGIGQPNAHKFHELACSAVREVIIQTQRMSSHDVTPFWAVAEEQCVGEWSDFPNISQGVGTLADRLDLVFKGLLQGHRSVILLAADSPQISPRHLLEAMDLLEKGVPFVLGKAHDGGFYLMGGQQPIEKELWQSITYSSSETVMQLAKRLKEIGDVRWLAELSDVDYPEDLNKLYLELEAETNLLPAQLELQSWLVNGGFTRQLRN